MSILIVVPAYNEDKIIKDNLIKLDDYLQINLADDYLIVLADNNSTDQTANICQALSQKNNKIDYFFISQKGKGRAVLKTWQHYLADFDIFIFMDADLATDLSAMILLLKALQQGNDLAIGSRYLKDSQVKRSVLRRLFSAVYRLFLKIFLGTKVKDFPCGFKAVKQNVVREIVPQIKNQAWFFDTELVYLAEKNSYKIKEIPVKWQEPRTSENKSKVSLIKVSWQYFKEVFRLKFSK